MHLFLYIDSMQFGGAQRVMNNIASYLVERGYKITLINDILPSDVEPEYAIDERIKRYFLDEGKPNGMNRNIYRIRKLRKLVKNEKPDVLLSFLGPPNIRALIATIGLSVKTMVSVRNDPYREYGNGILKHISRTVFRLADGCIFQTREAAKYFPKSVQQKSKIIVNPVNDKFYNVAWTGDKKEIAFVGRLQPQKNPLLALEAFHRVADEFPDYKLVYYGDEELKEEIIKKSIQYGIEDKVIIYGKTPDIEKMLSASTAFLLSSDYEGMPNALLEAMAVGTPVISTDCPCGGPRTVIENDKQGILVKCGDAAEMASALRTIICNKELQNRMSKEEQQRAQDYRMEKVMMQWNEYIET